MKSKINRVIKEVNLWTFAAISLPLISLAIIFFLKFIGMESMIDRLMTVGAIIFFSISVIWWWWAIAKIAFFAQVIDRVNNEFLKVRKDVSDIRKDM